MQYTTIPGVSFLVQDVLFETTRKIEPSLENRAKRDTKSVGDISELRVACALAESGYSVSKPLGENQRYDLIADDGERLQRVQVKTGRIRNGVVVFHCCSTHGHRRSALKTR